MFIYNRYFKFTLRFNKVNYFSKYNQYSNNLINNLSISTNYLLTKSNLFIQYRYYSSNKSNTLHFQNGDTNKLEILKSKGKSGI